LNCHISFATHCTFLLLNGMNYVMIYLDWAFSRLLNIVVLGYGFDVHTTWDDHSVGTKQETEDCVTPADVDKNSNLLSS